MGITITEDESDKKFRGAKEISKDMSERHRGDTNMADELATRSFQIDRTLLKNPNPKYAHRLVNRTKDGEQIALRQGMGYEIVPEKDPTQLNMSSRRDGAQVQGDLVLMRIPIEKYEEGRKLSRQRWQMMSGGKIEQTKENMRKIARDGGAVGPHEDAVVK